MGHPYLKIEFDQGGAGSDALEAGAGFPDVGQGDGMHELQYIEDSGTPVSAIPRLRLRWTDECVRPHTS